MSDIKFSCKISNTDPSVPLSFEAWIDEHKFFETDHVSDSQEISVNLNDDEAEHILRLIMKNKQPSHTKINEDGAIIQDARLIIENVAFDEIQLGQMFMEQALYEHDFNGTGMLIQDKFFGEMGCNGTISLKFYTPVYLWLLENM